LLAALYIGNAGPADWSPDGHFLLVNVTDVADANARSSLWVIRLERPGRPQGVPFASERRQGRRGAILARRPHPNTSCPRGDRHPGRDAASGHRQASVWPAWDMTPDGQRFLITKFVGDPAAESLTLIQNWPASLK